MSETPKEILNPDFETAFDRLDHSGLPPDQIRERIIAEGIPQYLGSVMGLAGIDRDLARIIVRTTREKTPTDFGIDRELARRIVEAGKRAPSNPRPFGNSRNVGPRHNF